MTTKQNIEELIGKFLAGEAGPEEAMRLEDWKNASAENGQLFRQYQAVFELSTGVNDETPDSAAAWEKLKPALGKQIKLKPLYPVRSYVRVAAAVALLIGIASLLLYLFKPAPEPLLSFTSKDSAREVKLEDNTQITVFPHSQLSRKKGYGISHRQVRLRGNAFFTVTHQETLPFVVDAGTVYIKDLGTKFSLHNSVNEDTLWVKVDEGEVLLFDSLGLHLSLHASEKACYIRSSHEVQKTIASVNADSLTFHFEHASLGSVVDTLSKAYGVRITLENDGIRNCPITTVFRKEQLETVLNVIAETLGLSYTRTSEGYSIKGTQCNP